MFPQGGPGIALVLLRLSVAGMFLLRFLGRTVPMVPSWVLFVAMLLASFLSLGAFTPIVCVLICFVDFFYCMQASGGEALWLGSAVFNALALALLGPGAYSVDAWLYGRRVVVVPPPKQQKGH